jgi:ribonuclease BN (tRNA processing enzyme)
VRLTVLGSGTAQPQPDSPASGLLVQSGDTALLLDAGTGVVTRLESYLDPRTLTAVVVGHLHGDHFLDLVPLRYLFPWAGGVPRRLPVHVPPGQRPRIDALAEAISERRGFFDDAFEVSEYDPDAGLSIGGLRIDFRRARHYVPAWSMALTDPTGGRVVYLGDTGPSEPLVEFAAGADVLLMESTLGSTDEDDVERGHLTPAEAIDIAHRAGARRALIVHYPSARRAEIERLCAADGPLVTAATPGTVVEIGGREARSAPPGPELAAR